MRPTMRHAIRLASTTASVSVCAGTYCPVDPTTASIEALAAACIGFGTTSDASVNGGWPYACPCDITSPGSAPQDILCMSVSAALQLQMNGGTDPNAAPSAADCQYGSWSDWSPCPADCTYKCGQSRPQRFRTAPIVRGPLPGGRPCEWDQMYQTAECAAPDGSALPVCEDPVNCVVAEDGWSDWTACPPCSDAFAVAWQFRYGSISQLASAGGVDCRAEDLAQSRSCAIALAGGLVPAPSDDPDAGCATPPPAPSCAFAPVSADPADWSPCTVPCNGGVQFQTRALLSGDPNECADLATVYRACATQSCGSLSSGSPFATVSHGPLVPPSWDMVDAQCDYLCLAGTPALPLGGNPSAVQREALFKLTNMTAAVVTPAETAFVCPTAASLGLGPTTTVTTLDDGSSGGAVQAFVNTFSGVVCGAPVDCVYGTWSDWSACSGDFCATGASGSTGGVRTRERLIARMGGARGGVPCDPAALMETLPCGEPETSRGELADCLRSAAFAGAYLGTVATVPIAGPASVWTMDDTGGAAVIAACRAAFPTQTVTAAQWSPWAPTEAHCFGDAGVGAWTQAAEPWCAANPDGGFDARNAVLIASLAVWPASAIPAHVTGPGFYEDATTGAAVVVPAEIGGPLGLGVALEYGSTFAGFPPRFLNGYSPPLTVNASAHPAGSAVVLSSIPGGVSAAEEALAGFASVTVWGTALAVDSGYALPQTADAPPAGMAASRVFRADCGAVVDCVPGPWFDSTECDPNGCGDPPYKWQNRQPLVQASGGGKPCSDFAWQQTVSCPTGGFGCDAAIPCLYGTWPSTQTSSVASFCASALGAAGFTADTVPFFQDALSVATKRAWLAENNVWPVLNKQWQSISTAAVPTAEVFSVIRFANGSFNESPMNQSEAAAACALYGGTLATLEQLETAQATAGAQVCSWGWTADFAGTAFPMQYNGVSGCGAAGVNTYSGADAAGAAFCFGDTRGFQPSETIGSLSLQDFFNHYATTLSADAQPSARAAAWAAAGVNAPFQRDAMGGPPRPVQGALAVRLNMQCSAGNWCVYDSDLDLGGSEFSPRTARGWALLPNYGWRRFDGASGAIAGEGCLLATSLSARLAQTVQVSQSCVPLELSCGVPNLGLWDPTVQNFGQAPGACVCPSLCPYVPAACAWDTGAAGSGLCDAVGCGMKTSKLMFRGIQQQPSEECSDEAYCACDPVFLASATTCEGPPCPPACPVACNGLPCGGPGIGTCDESTGTCVCAGGRGGDDCWATCPSDAFGVPCSGNGTCNATTNECTCDAGFSGPACSFVKHAYVQNFGRVQAAYWQKMSDTTEATFLNMPNPVPAPPQCGSAAEAAQFCDMCVDRSLPLGLSAFATDLFPAGETGAGTPWLRSEGTLVGAGSVVQHAEFPGYSCADLGFDTSDSGLVLSSPLGSSKLGIGFETGAYGCATLSAGEDWTACGVPDYPNEVVPGLNPPIGLLALNSIQVFNGTRMPLYMMHYKSPGGRKPTL